MMDAARPTQYDRIIRALIKVGPVGCTYLSLMVAARSGSPWKRLAELEQKGYRFNRWQVKHNSRNHTVVALGGRPQA